MMDPDNPQFLELSDRHGARRIAYRLQRIASDDRPALVWFSGFLSDMASTKAEALAVHARRRGLTLLRFDYSGHGQSSGKVTEGTIGRWLHECESVLGLLDQPAVLIGSSMGAWLALLLLQKSARGGIRAAVGAVLIAPAWDMTEALMWRRFSSEVRAEIERNGVYRLPSAYGADGYPITRALIEEGRSHLIESTPFDPGCPIRILHGMRDPDVPWERSLELAELLTGDDVGVTLLKDGDHRLSRPRELARLMAAIDELTGLDQDALAKAAMPSR